MRFWVSPRHRVMGSAGIIGFLAGFFLTGKVLEWAGVIERTAHSAANTLKYIPYMIGGGIALGLVFVCLAMIAFHYLNYHDE